MSLIATSLPKSSTFGSRQTLHSLLRAATSDYGQRQKIALRSLTREWSYDEFEARVSTVAVALASRGVSQGDVVAIAACRTFETVVTIYALMSIGATYLPIDKRSPAERVGYMVAITSCAYFVTDEPDQYRACLDSARLVVLDELTHAPPAVSAIVDLDPEEIAYVMFTSGTTGVPKAVPIRHSSVVGLIEWAIARFSRDDLSCVLASTSFSFDVSIFELFAPIASGGSLFLVDSILCIADLPSSAHITMVNAAPSALTALLADSMLPIGPVRVFLLAGETLSSALVRQLYDTGAKQIFNLYGPTEDTVFSTEYLAEPHSAGSVPLGRPLPGHHVLVVDDKLQPLPNEAIGEICVMGSGLSLGYLGQPELTAQRYVPAPAGTMQPLMYRTGDLGHIDREGLLHFHGRSDHQVKLRGQRVELDEIASVIASVDGVAQAVVRLRTRDGTNGLQAQWLVAYVVTRRKHQDRACLRRAIKDVGFRRLPNYMRPDMLVFLDVLPLNTSGKVDERKLDRVPMPSEAEMEPTP